MTALWFAIALGYGVLVWSVWALMTVASDTDDEMEERYRKEGWL